MWRSKSIFSSDEWWRQPDCHPSTHPSSLPYPMTTLHCYAYAPPPLSKPPPMAASGLLALSSPSSVTTTHPSPPFPPLLSFPYSSSNHAHHPPFRALLFLGKPNSRPFLSPSVFALGSLVTAHEAPTTPPMAAVDAAPSRVQPPIDAHFRLPPNIPSVLAMQVNKRIKLSFFFFFPSQNVTFSRFPCIYNSISTSNRNIFSMI